MENKKWLVPSYYKEFKCKCEKCRRTCCSNWKIGVSQKEYFNLIGMECSKELHEKIEVSFSDVKFPTPELYKYISYNWLGNCPMQKDGLCLLHLEKGSSYLPQICRLYPRSLKSINGNLVACLSSSCERVVELLYEESDYKLIEEVLEEEPTIKLDINDKAIEDITLFNQILKENDSLKNSLIKICKIVNEKEFNLEYKSNEDPISCGLKILNRFTSSDDFYKDIANKLIERYKDLNQYYIDKDNFEKKYPNHDVFFKNVINNSLLYETFPFVDERFDQTNAFKGLCATYGLLRLFSIGYTSICDEDYALIDCVSELFHLIEHTAFYYNANVILDNAAILLKI